MEGYVDATHEPFELVMPAQLYIPAFERMAVIYDVLELSTAVKPWLLRWLLQRTGGEGALYLDPDMRLYAPLDNVFDAVREHKLVLSPHNIEPMPRDGKRPNEQDILIAGVYNLGFIGIGSGEFADRLLDWWGERLERDCIVDPERGFFVDQRWIDLVPSLTDSFHLLRDAGFNVAYWNLATRLVSFRDGRWWVKSDVPLRLSISAATTSITPSGCPSTRTASNWPSTPTCGACATRTRQELLANGVEEVASLPYTYAATASGIPLNNAMRRIHRDLFTSDFHGSVFEPEGERAFIATLNEPAEHGGDRGVTRYLAALHERRPDLQASYPNLDRPADAQGYLDWIDLFGRGEVPIPPVLLPEATLEQTGAALSDFEAPGPLGVNVAGYLQSELGVGEVARQAIDALDHAGVASLPVSVRAPAARQGHDFAHVAPYAESYPVNLICVNADMLPQFAGSVGTDFFNRRYSIGWWWWEVADFPERWLGSFRYVDEVWAGSAYVAEALAAVSPVPVSMSRRRSAGRSRGLLARRARVAGRVPVPVHVRLRLGLRAQEPARDAASVPACVPRAGAGVAGAQEHQRRAASVRVSAAQGGRGRPRACAYDRPLREPDREEPVRRRQRLRSCRCTAPRASGSGWPRRC